MTIFLLCEYMYVHRLVLNVDINECQTTNPEYKHNCSIDSYCVNTPGSFQCRCNSGLTGSLCNSKNKIHLQTTQQCTRVLYLLLLLCFEFLALSITYSASECLNKRNWLSPYIRLSEPIAVGTVSNDILRVNSKILKI